MVIAIRVRMSAVVQATVVRRQVTKSETVTTALTMTAIVKPTVETQIVIQILPAAAGRRNRRAPRTANAALTGVVKKGCAYKAYLQKLSTLNKIQGRIRLQPILPFSISTQFYFASRPKALNDAKILQTKFALYLREIKSGFP